MQTVTKVKLLPPFRFTLSEVVYAPAETDEDKELYGDEVPYLEKRSYSAKIPHGRDAQQGFAQIFADIADLFMDDVRGSGLRKAILDFLEKNDERSKNKGTKDEADEIGIAELLAPFASELHRSDDILNILIPYAVQFTTVNDVETFRNTTPIEAWIGVVGSLIWVYKQMDRGGAFDALKKSDLGATTRRDLNRTITAVG